MAKTSKRSGANNNNGRRNSQNAKKNGRNGKGANSVKRIPDPKGTKVKKKSSIVPVGYVLPTTTTKNLTKAMVLRCIVGSGGIIARIAGRANTSYSQMYKWIYKRRTTDKEIKAALEREENRMGDTAEITILDAMMQRLDVATASRTAQWYLAQRAQRRGYRSKKTLVHEGGDKPIGIETTEQIALEDLDLDLSTRKTVLQAVRAKKKGKKS